MLQIAVLVGESGVVEQSVMAAVGMSGKVSLVHNSSTIDTDHCDAVLVDARTGAPDAASLGHLRQLHCPVLAIVDSDQAEADQHTADAFDDWATPGELDTSPFRWRLQRLIARYQSPIQINALAQPEVRLLQIVSDHCNDWLILKDLEHRFLLVSESFAKVVGLPREQIIGKNDLEIGSTEESVHGCPEKGWIGFWPQDDAVVASGEPSREDNPKWSEFESDCKRHRITERIPLKNAKGEVYALLVCSSDVTEFMQTAQDLADRSRMLRQVMEEKHRAEQSRQLAEQAIQAKNKFMAAASHDLRQPLHAQGLFLDVLSRRLQDEKNKELVKKIQHSSDSLVALFNSLLDISKLDAGTVNPERQHFPIEPLMQTLREGFIELGAKKSLDVSIDSCAEVVHSDPILCGRVLRNLIQNAVTHTEEGSVRVGCKRDDAHLVITIVDTGPGIPSAEHQAIFSEFYQLNGNKRASTRGLGLGLAIVKRLSALLDIELSMESVVDKGTQFMVRIPLGEWQQIGQSTPSCGNVNLGGFTVLVIDDEADIREGMRHMLQPYGCKTLVASSAFDALTLFHNDDLRPDIIVADYRLRHGMTADSAIETVRASLGSTIPAIVVTGDTSSDRLQQADCSGYALLHKPVQSVELVQTIAATLIHPANV